jgi:hypothetical protein
MEYLVKNDTKTFLPIKYREDLVAMEINTDLGICNYRFADKAFWQNGIIVYPNYWYNDIGEMGIIAVTKEVANKLLILRNELAGKVDFDSRSYQYLTDLVKEITNEKIDYWKVIENIAENG